MQHFRQKFSRKNSSTVLATLMMCFTAQSLSLSAMAEPPGQMNLDLGSTHPSVPANNAGTVVIGGSLNGSGNVQGGTPMTVAPGQLLTPAMNTALAQVTGGSQTLLLNTGGAATAGYASVSSAAAGNFSSLVVPSGVSFAAVGFNPASAFNVSGYANVMGSLYALQTVVGQTAAMNFANSLNIASSGLLSTNLPADQILPGLFSSKDLNLSVAHDLNNNGQIFSGGNLNLAVGGALNNVSVTGSPAASISAQNLNIISGSGNIVNSGLLSAVNTININTAAATTDLIINNTAGTIAALENGVLNLRSFGPDIESANTGVWGGLLDAQGGINMFGKAMLVHVDEIRGTISNTGSESHISVQTGFLDIGPQILSGDPTYYNSNGDLAVSNLQTVPGNLVIVASGDITLNNGGSGTFITATAGSSIFMGAGLSFTASPDSSIGTFPNNNTGNATSTLSNFAPSSTGGNINSANHELNMQTNMGGTLTVIACANGKSGKGNISFGDGILQTANGAITIIGEGDITINPLSSKASISTNNGSITIASAVPGNLNSISFGANGTPFAASPTVGTLTGTLNLAPGGFVSVNGGGTITLSANTGIYTGGILNTASGATTTLTTNTGGISVSGMGTDGPITIQALDKTNSGKVAVNGIISNTGGFGGVTIDSASGPIFIFNENFPNTNVGVQSKGAISIGNLTGTTQVVIGGGLDNDAGFGDITVYSATGPIMSPQGAGGPGYNINAAEDIIIQVNGANASASSYIDFTTQVPCFVMNANLGGVFISAPGSIEVNSIDSASDVIITANSTAAVNTGAVHINGTITSPTKVAITAPIVNLAPVNPAPGIGTNSAPVPSVIITGLDGLDLTFNNSGFMHAGSSIDSKAVGISIFSPAGYDLNLSNVNNNNGVMTIHGFGSINLTATPDGDSANQIRVTGNSNWPLFFATPAFFNASGQQQLITVEYGAALIGSSTLTLNTNVLVAPGTLLGAPLVFNPTGAGTISNAKDPFSFQGLPLNLSASFPAGITTGGQSLAIISSSDIVSTGAITIDLSNVAAGYGGTLTMLAGFDYFTGPPNSKFSPSLFTDFDPSNSGGNIKLSNVTINTSSVGGSAGNVYVVANGSVSLGPIISSGALAAGQVNILGNGVSVKSITATGTTKGGIVTINSGLPQISDSLYPSFTQSSISIKNGIFYGGTITPSEYQGNISFGTIDAGTGVVSLATGSTGLLKQASGTVITCDILGAVTGTGNISLKVNTANLVLPFLGFSGGTQGGKITITDLVPVTVFGSNTFYNATSLTLIAPAGATFDSGKATFGTLDVKSTGGPITFAGGTFEAITVEVTNTSSLNKISVTGGTILNGGKSITMAGAGGIDISSIGGAGAKLSAQKISLTSSLGSITLGDGAQLSSTKDTTIKATAGGITIGSNAKLSAGGPLSGASTSPLSLTSAMIPTPGKITMTAGGVAGITSLGSSSSFTSNGNMTITASKGGVKFGDATSITVNGGKLKIDAKGGDFELGTAAQTLLTQSNLTVRQLNNASGSVAITAGNKLTFAPFTKATVGGTMTLTATGTAGDPTASVILDANSDINVHDDITLTAKGSSASVNIEDGASVDAGVTFAVVGAPAGAGALKVSSGLNVSIDGSVSSTDGVTKITATGTGGKIFTGDSSQIQANNSTLTMTSADTLALGSGALQADGTIALSSTKSGVGLDGTILNGEGKTTITGMTSLTIEGQAQVKSLGDLSIVSKGAGSILTIGGDKAAGTGVTLEAGKLNAAASGNVPPANIVSKGILSLKAPVVNIADNGSSLTSNGGNLQVTAMTGNLSVGTNNNFTANGGNIVMLAKSNVTGSTGNAFTAYSTGTTASNSKGGGIEIGSGLTSSSKVVAALASNPMTLPVPPALLSSLASTPANLTVNITQGVIKANITGVGSSIDLTNGGANAVLNMPGAGLPGQQGGAQVFDAAAGTSVKFDGGTFNTAGLKPISMEEQSAVVLQSSSINANHKMAKIYSSPGANFVQRDDGSIDLSKGELFIDTIKPLHISSESVSVSASANALLSIKTVQGNTYVKSCSGSGKVTVTIDGTTVSLNPGEELVVSNHKPDSSEVHPSDGIGRRNSRTIRTDNHHIAIHDFAIISMLANSNALPPLRTASNEHKQLLSRLLKTAATIDVVLKHRGAYQSAN